MPQLVAEAADLPPGTPWTSGVAREPMRCGWPRRGWQVVAVDFAATALERGAAGAAAAGAEVAARIDWVRADVTPLDAGAGDLRPRVGAVHAPAAGTAPGAERPPGAPPSAPAARCCVVGHDVSDVAAGAHRPDRSPSGLHRPRRSPAHCDSAAWRRAGGRGAATAGPPHEGHDIDVHDAVLRARRRN